MVDSVDAPDQIEGLGLEGRLEEVGLQDRLRRRCAAGGPRVRCCKIDAHDCPVRRDLPLQPTQRLPGPAARIQYAHAWHESESGYRLAQLRLGEPVEQPQLVRVVAY